MNWLNHFLVPSTILLILFGDDVSLLAIASFTIMFGILPDSDFIIRRYLLKNTSRHLRTWVQEPFGIIAIGLPAGLLSALLWEHPYLFLVLVPYVSHVLLDYLTVHTTFPLTPFSHREFKTGFIRPFNPTPSNPLRPGIFSENYILLINILILIILMALP